MAGADEPDPWVAAGVIGRMGMAVAGEAVVVDMGPGVGATGGIAGGAITWLHAMQDAMPDPRSGLRGGG
jgi:hypothetical protein